MGQKKSRWMPQIGAVASYVGRNGTLARGGYNVRVIAESCADRMLVEAIGRSGAPVRFTVKRENLAPASSRTASAAAAPASPGRRAWRRPRAA